jgi:predicted alpha/beta hydrolase family esterase
MALGQDLRAVGPAVLQLPTAALRRGVRQRREPWLPSLRQPVLLVHGYAGTNAVWDPVVEDLRGRGFGYVLRLSYSALTTDVTELARVIAEQAAAAVARTGAHGVHLVGHSLGGLMIRYTVQCTSFPVPATTVVTIATPHRGLAVARLAPGRGARLMHPRTPFLSPAARILSPAVHAGAPTRWVAYYSDGDRLVRPSSARLDEPGLDATNVHVPGRGHLTICRDPRLVAGVTRELLHSEVAARRQEPERSA